MDSHPNRKCTQNNRKVTREDRTRVLLQSPLRRKWQQETGIDQQSKFRQITSFIAEPTLPKRGQRSKRYNQKTGRKLSQL